MSFEWRRSTYLSPVLCIITKCVIWSCSWLEEGMLPDSCGETLNSIGLALIMECWLLAYHYNRPLASSLQSLIQSESRCEIFVTVISSNFNLITKLFFFFTDTWRGRTENCLPTFDSYGWFETAISCHCNGGNKQTQQRGSSPTQIW